MTCAAMRVLCVRCVPVLGWGAANSGETCAAKYVLQMLCVCA